MVVSDFMSFSVVIPTLWKSKRIFQLIDDLEENNIISQIILIDNSNKKENYRNWKKTSIFIPPSNLFVAASWNTGVKLCTNENICICNDDINFDTKIFEIISNLNIKGIIGQAYENYNRNYSGDISISELNYSRPMGWGCLLFTKKDLWRDIPEQLRVWYNDDWMIRFNPATKYVMYNYTIFGEMSVSGDSQEFSEIKKQDLIHWQNIQAENNNY